MTFEVFHTKEELKRRRDVMEIAPGIFNDVYFSDSSIFVDEDDFVYAETAVKQFFPEYCHYDTNDIPRDIGHQIITQWIKTSNLLKDEESVEAHTLFSLPYKPNQFKSEFIERERRNISNMLNVLASFAEKKLQTNSHFFISGP